MSYYEKASPPTLDYKPANIKVVSSYLYTFVHTTQALGRVNMYPNCKFLLISCAKQFFSVVFLFFGQTRTTEHESLISETVHAVAAQAD